MIDRENIWNKTYKKENMLFGDALISVFTAIHHYKSDESESRLDLCSELIIEFRQGVASFKAEFDLTAEQMETLAQHLIKAAERTRANQALLDEDRKDEKSGDGGSDVGNAESDPLYDQAVDIVLKNNRASVSLVQLHLRIGYNRSALLIEAMEKAGIVSPMRAGGAREVLTRREAA